MGFENNVGDYLWNMVKSQHPRWNEDQILDEIRRIQKQWRRQEEISRIVAVDEGVSPNRVANRLNN